MINAKEAKTFINIAIIKELDRIAKVLTIADLGLKARQVDVTKVKELITKRIEKLSGTEQKTEG